MRRHLLAAGIAVAALLPTALLAQQTCEQRSENRVVGTLAGAGIGAVLGGMIAGHDDRTAGVVIGGVGGAVAGNQLSGRGDCTRAYGYYDNNDQWHANDVQPASAQGYYDRNGGWVQGAPNGYYTNGHLVPVSAGGYYETDGRWVAGVASGHYDADGRWDATPSIGRYDEDGRWIQGQAAGHRDGNGRWVSDAQPGYYQNGRWTRGQAYGYYDTRGSWIETQPFAGQRAPDANPSYRHAGYGPADWNGAGDGFNMRRSWLEAGIHRGMNNGTLARQDGWQALRQLSALRNQERHLRHYHGMLGRDDAQRMQARLDDVASNLRWSRLDETRRF
jgi:hypothetical protein